MIELTQPLEKVIKSNNFDKLKPFAIMFRNKWNATENKFILDTENPIDISNMIVKPNTLSMTLDVSEIAQFKANNITLTLHDPFNKFLEGTPYTYFTSGYQLYGSQVILYYGLDNENKTSLFVGIIKELPTHKPEQYQLELKLISPLELLNDIEAKEFSDKYEGEALIADGFDDDNNPIYKTSHTGVGGFNAVYADSANSANSTKMFEGVDFQVADTNALNLPAKITIINTDLHTATITADYYCWKTDLSVEQIISGLVALGGYTAEKGNTDIRSVVWQNEVRNLLPLEVDYAIGYYYDGNNLMYNWYDVDNWESFEIIGRQVSRKSIFPSEFTINFMASFQDEGGAWQGWESAYFIGDELGGNGNPRNGYGLLVDHLTGRQRVIKWTNNTIEHPTTGEYASDWLGYARLAGIQVKNGYITILSSVGTFGTYNLFFTPAWESFRAFYNDTKIVVSGGIKFSTDISSQTIPPTAEQYNRPVVRGAVMDRLSSAGHWGGFITTLQKISETALDVNYSLQYSHSADNITFSNLQPTSINANTGIENRYIYFVFQIINGTPTGANLLSPQVSYYISSLTLSMVNLSNKTILETLQDFALISGYEFGVNRNGVFFFRPRSQSTTPIYDLGHNEIVKVETINKKFNDFFTKLTLQFAQVPLEFYANEGERPTPVDRYGIINKEIDKPEIVNYDNPELAQAIGPQLLAIYSKLADIIQVSAKLNLSLELGDIINLKRNYNLTAEPSSSDLSKFQKQDTYFQACKIVGLNYNFSKRQMTYTLRNVSNENNRPQYEYDEFIYELPLGFGVKTEE